ncbi:MAG: hypothetical protein ACK4UP_06160 [Spirosomataceae bacterium]
MSAVVCTLFEGNYHHGVAALVNSLYQHGFRGTVYAGYKGSLPPWVEKTKQVLFAENLKAEEFLVTEGLSITFVKLDTDYHLTNYKPAFMLQVVDNLKHNIDSIFYFDPDIVVKCNWEFYLHWVSCGIAAVHESVSSDMPENHPRRFKWAEISKTINLSIHHSLKSYFNAGFVGINTSNIQFLHIWEQLTVHAIERYGMEQNLLGKSDNQSVTLVCTDQDLFNLGLMITKEPISEFGPEGMDFISGGWLMSHATGSPKPWNKKYLSSLLAGYPPTRQDKEFYKYVNLKIKTINPREVSYKRVSMKVSSFLGRFYRRY